ncbi:S9 family peptidase [Salisediminibacterium beveridgei]|uniref:Acylamino-acid-releasing enzyme n=1 Tax=Salisediminibacterium beveridgei TaxID=632773 RepID=A0A1D7QU47_9BACI|nr:S9 family peptidase [Salisediminibacterium beveridgei]AOM82517.1 Acylamino-acid-releasing enzyme [Salisediminibacterium beveridgei]
MDNHKKPVNETDLKKLRILADPILDDDTGNTYFLETIITSDNQYATHLYKKARHSEDAVAMTSGPRSIKQPRLSPNQKTILYLRKPESKKEPQLFFQPLQGGEGKQITEVPGGIHGAEWSRSGKQILLTLRGEVGEQGDQLNAFTEKKEEPSDELKKPYIATRIDYKTDARGFDDGMHLQTALIDLATHSIRILTPHDADYQFQDYCEEQESLLVTANLGTDTEVRSDLYEIRMDNGSYTMDYLAEGLTVQQARYLNNSGEMVLLAHDKAYLGATHSDLYRYDSNNQKASNVTKTFDCPIGDQMIADIRFGDSSRRFTVDSEREIVFTLVSNQGETQLYQFDLSGTKEPLPLTHGQHHVYNFYLSDAEALVAVSNPVSPGELYMVPLTGSGQLKPVTYQNQSWLDNTSCLDMEEVRIRSTDGKEIQGWVIGAAASMQNGSLPAILEIHGGPHAMYGYSFFHELQLLAQEGYAIMLANPRGSHGYGQEHVNAVRGDYGGMDYEDLMCFVDGCLERYPQIDSERLGVTGGSYGGFMTNWIIAHTDRFKAAATLRSICNWTSFFGVSDIGYFFTEWEIGDDLFSNPDKLWHHSPLRLAAHMNTPLLILHGEKDLRCPIEQAEQLFSALRFQDKDVRFVRMPDANHELSRSGPPELRESRLVELREWFNSKL